MSAQEGVREALILLGREIERESGDFGASPRSAEERARLAMKWLRDRVCPHTEDILRRAKSDEAELATTILEIIGWGLGTRFPDFPLSPRRSPKSGSIASAKDPLPLSEHWLVSTTLPRLTDRWLGHRDLLRRCLEVSFLDPYTGEQLGPERKRKLSLKFDDAAASPVIVEAAEGQIRITVAGELYLRTRAATLALIRCRSFRDYPRHFFAPSLTLDGLEKALKRLLRWTGHMESAQADVENCLSELGTLEPCPRYSMLGSESEVATFLSLLAMVTFRLHDHFLRTYLRDRELQELTPSLRHSIKDALDLITIMVIGAGQADQLMSDLHFTHILPAAKRYRQRVAQFSTMCGMSSGIARRMIGSADAGSEDHEALGQAWDIILPLHFRDTIGVIAPGVVPELAHAAYLNGLVVFANASRQPVPDEVSKSRFEDWSHDIAEISALLRNRVVSLQGPAAELRIEAGVEAYQNVRSSMDLARWKQATALFDPKGPVNVDIFRTRAEIQAK